MAGKQTGGTHREMAGKYAGAKQSSLVRLEPGGRTLNSTRNHHQGEVKVSIELSLQSIFSLCKFCLFRTCLWKLQSRAMAFLKTFLQGKSIFAGGSSILAFLGNPANVIFSV